MVRALIADMIPRSSSRVTPKSLVDLAQDQLVAPAVRKEIEHKPEPRVFAEHVASLSLS
jgi:hypothetical protein